MSPRQQVIKLLDRWEKTDAYADILLENAFNQNKFLSQDRALIQEIFFGVIRWHKRLNWIVNQFYQGKLAKSPRFVRHILQSSFYQLIYLERIPSHAVINEAVELAKSKGGRFWAGKVNAILRTFLRKPEKIKFPDRSTSPVEHISVQYSFPKWIVQRWIKRWGVDETIALCKANNKRPEISLRINRLKISLQQFQELLSQSQISIKQSVYNENFFRTGQIQNLSQFQPFQQGLFSIQDESAGLTCQLLKPESGEKIIDLCAAPGGKTTYLTELSKAKATIFSIDQSFSRLNLVTQNLKRLGLKTRNLIQSDGRQFVSKQVDKILIDAPCSGLGVLSKRVDLRWKRTAEQIDELSAIQLDLLRNAAMLVKSGGAIVYSTCTIEPEENENVVEKFLIENNNIQIDPAGRYVPKIFTTSEGYINTYPHIHGIDGSFAVRLIKK